MTDKQNRDDVEEDDGESEGEHGKTNDSVDSGMMEEDLENEHREMMKRERRLRKKSLELSRKERPSKMSREAWKKQKEEAIEDWEEAVKALNLIRMTLEGSRRLKSEKSKSGVSVRNLVEVDQEGGEEEEDNDDESKNSQPKEKVVKSARENVVQRPLPVPTNLPKFRQPGGIQAPEEFLAKF